MYAERLKDSIGGITGSFTLKDGEVIETDLDCDLGFVTQSILYLSEAVTETKDLTRLIIFGEKQNLSVHFHSEYILGVLMARTGNVQLLHLMVRRILETPEEELSEAHLPELEDRIPYFDRPRKDVLSNVPAYARQVLEYVDGTRTIKEIIEESTLPPEVVLDVILSYRRSSVLHYNPPSTLQDHVPYFDRPKEEVISNVPAYARQVLEYVDGTRTIKEIIEESALPPEVVLDVILSYRRSSVLHYKS